MESWVQVSSGQGPTECMRAAWHLVRKLEVEAKELQCTVELLKAESGPEAKSFRSVLLKVKGNKLEQLQEKWQGTIQWKGKSPFRPFHKRQNWFVQPKKYDLRIKASPEG